MRSAAYGLPRRRELTGHPVGGSSGGWREPCPQHASSEVAALPFIHPAALGGDDSAVRSPVPLLSAALLLNQGWRRSIGLVRFGLQYNR
jgi:hypothetical protein